VDFWSATQNIHIRRFWLNHPVSAGTGETKTALCSSAHYWHYGWNDSTLKAVFSITLPLNMLIGGPLDHW
jgi:hypothetical protein